MGRPRHGDKEIWEKVVHNLSVWQRRAIIATLIIAARPVPDYLQPDEKWITEEVVRHLSEHGGTMKTGAELIAEERDRQINVEGWTPEHDDAHTHRELAMAACAYAGYTTASTHENARTIAQSWWPDEWDQSWFKPTSHISNLVKAGALIAAEIDRLQRLNETLQEKP